MWHRPFKNKTLEAGICLLLAVSSWSQAAQPIEHKPAISEWMRGVPSGCRLVAFDLQAHDSRKLVHQNRVDVSLEYAAADDRFETLVLFANLTVLATDYDDDKTLRVTFALTPDQAQRVRLAACCGKIRIQEASHQFSIDNQAVRGWEVRGIKDRTEAIEAHLANDSDTPSRLKRPTLATHTAPLGKQPHDVITIPVRIEVSH